MLQDDATILEEIAHSSESYWRPSRREPGRALFVWKAYGWKLA